MAGQTKTKKKTKGTLRISAGAGDGHVVDGEIAARHAGRRVGDALADIIEQHVSDPHLLAMLREPRVALDLYGRDEDGETEELPLSPNEEWDRVLESMEQADTQLAVERSHIGGGGRHGRRGGERAARVDRSFPRQEVVTHPGEYAPTDADRADVDNGRAVCIRGFVLAKVLCICQELGGREALWYFLAPADDPTVICDVIVPKQTGTAGRCKADGREVVRAARRARERGMSIVSAGHSHGWGALFSSTTDHDEMLELATERVGKFSQVTLVGEGTIRELQDVSQEGQAFEARFADNPATTVRIATNGRGDRLSATDLTVRLHQSRHKLMSWFSTHNARGKHMIPMLTLVSCPQCGSSHQRRIDAKNVTVHVIGPVAIGDEQRAALSEEVRRKVRGSSWGYYTVKADSGETDPDSDEISSQAPGSVDTTAAGAPGAYLVYRRGFFTGRVPAAVMERAAAETPALAAALGWESADEAEAHRREGAAHDA